MCRLLRADSNFTGVKANTQLSVLRWGPASWAHSPTSPTLLWVSSPGCCSAERSLCEASMYGLLYSAPCHQAPCRNTQLSGWATAPAPASGPTRAAARGHHSCTTAAPQLHHSWARSTHLLLMGVTDRQDNMCTRGWRQRRGTKPSGSPRRLPRGAHPAATHRRRVGSTHAQPSTVVARTDAVPGWRRSAVPGGRSAAEDVQLSREWEPNEQALARLAG